MPKESYAAALIVIGDEILSGRTKDVNTAYIAENLCDSGIKLREVRVIPDHGQTIIDTVNEMRAAHDYVFTTGGIGPTHDDITAENVAKAFGVELELNEAAYQKLLDHYKNPDNITESSKKMAMIPAGAELIENPVSGAPGIHIGNVYVFAGVPRIMQAMFDSILPTLQGGAPILSRSVTCQLAESRVADGLAKIQDQYDTVSIGSYPKYENGKFGTSLVLRGEDADILEQVVQAVTALVISLGEENPVIV